ncbi:MAG: VWA domain-containing protein [Candidatus Korobacteraceae bacterium]
MKLRAVLLLLVFFLATLSWAQQSSSGAESETLTSNTELVLVPAQVKGHDGKPLLGLKQEDFILRSDGKPEPIRVFEESLRSAAAPTTQTTAAHAAPPDRISNLPDGGMPDQILIIAIDLVNTAFLDQTWAKKQLLKYLSNELPNQHFALVAITKDGLAQIHNFSSDPAVLVEALQRVQGSMDKNTNDEPPLASLTATSQFGTPCHPADEYGSMMAAFRDTQIYGAYAQKIMARATLTGLMQIAQAYAGVPGRKSVIWLTGGMPMLLYDAFAGGAKGYSALNGDSELIPEYEAAFSALNNANVAIYGVDVKGIGSDKTYHATGINQAMNNPVYQTRANGNVVSPLASGDEAIKVLSAATGGKSCTANADLKNCIDQAVEDSNSYYMLGFYVPQQNRKAGWHKLEVKLVAEKGSVRSRNSYYLSASTEPTEKEINRSLRAAADARIGYTGIGFAVQRQEGAGNAGKPPAPMMRITVPPSSVLLSSGHPQLSYDIATVPLTNKGEPASDLRVIHLNLTEEQTQSALNKGWAYFDPPQGSATQAVKYILRDNGTGHIGTLVVSPVRAGAGG